MIVPLSGQADWTEVWRGAESWQPPETPTLVIAPHPDDETLAAGGTIAMLREKGVPVRVVAVTDGENAYEDGLDIAGVRRAEQTAALERLGVEASEIVRLGLTDSGVVSEEKVLIERLLPMASKETHMLVSWPGDFHPDHEACGRAAQIVARITGAALTFYFFWTWHRGTPILLRDFPLRSVALTAQHQRAKAEALSLHQSQLNHPSGQPILPDELLWPARCSSEVFLPA